MQPSPSGQIAAAEAPIPLHPSRSPPNPPPITSNLLMRIYYHASKQVESEDHLGNPG
jgi:hypothetical protein